MFPQMPPADTFWAFLICQDHPTGYVSVDMEGFDLALQQALQTPPVV